MSAAASSSRPVNLQGVDPLMRSLQAVSSALQSGNIAAAQSALTKFQKQLQGVSPTYASQPFGNNGQANSAYQSLVSFVHSGNLSAAQQALSGLKTDLTKPKSLLSSTSSQASSGQTSSVQAAGDLQSVGSALKSGNLSSALSVLTSIQASSFGGNGQAYSDYQALVTALQSGNVLAAQEAYAALDADLS